MAVREYTQLSVAQDRNKRYVGQVDTAQIVNNKHAFLESGTVADGAVLARGTDGKVIPFTLVGDAFAGIVRRDLTNTNKYNTNESNVYDSVTNLDVPFINLGYIVVTVESAVVKGGSAFIRYGAGAGGTVLGAIRADADTATAVEVPTLKFAESADTGDLVRVVITQLVE